MAKYQDTFAPDDVVELRIHGVSNTPPASMLDIDPDQLQQVAGDEDTLIFRADAEVSPKRRVRAYSWGNLTQGRNLALKNVQRASGCCCCRSPSPTSHSGRASGHRKPPIAAAAPMGCRRSGCVSSP